MKFNFIDIDNEKYKTIPMNWCASRTYELLFKGWENLTLDQNDESFRNVLKMAQKSLEAFCEIYVETHVFTEPEFIWRPEKGFAIKIGTLEIEEYEKRINK
jgi:hypothetical protein